jgi:N-acetylmuramoyl-L-alanine amidase
MKSNPTAIKIANPARIAVVVGHCKSGDMGAWSEPLGIVEQKYNLRVANGLKSLNPNLYTIFYHEIQSYTSRQKALAKLINTGNFICVVELHFNASVYHTAQGSEVLIYKGSKKGREYGQIILDEIIKDFGLANRGVKEISSGNGFGFLSLMNPPAIIIEPFFGDEPKGANNFEDIEEYSVSLNNAFKRIIKT